MAAVRRARKERGSAILEAALVFLPMMALFFALMDFSIGIFVHNVLYHAVREGVRYAITQQTGANGQDAAITDVVQQNSMGFLSGAQGLTYISITYYNPKTMSTVTGAGSNAQGNLCIVSVNNFPWTWFAPVWRSPAALAFNAASSDMMEAPANGVLPAR